MQKGGIFSAQSTNSGSNFRFIDAWLHLQFSAFLGDKTRPSLTEDPQVLGHSLEMYAYD